MIDIIVTPTIIAIVYYTILLAVIIGKLILQFYTSVHPLGFFVGVADCPLHQNQLG